MKPAVVLLVSLIASMIIPAKAGEAMTVREELEMWRAQHMYCTAAEPVEVWEEPEETTETERTFTDREERYLMQIAVAEAEGEGVEGQALIMMVVLNRVNDPRFPNEIGSVILQDGQFTPVKNGRFDKVVPNEDSVKALEMVKSGWDESNGALYFERTTTKSTWHSRKLQRLFEHGHHTFYAG